MTKYQNVGEITRAFLRKGWTKDIAFVEVTTNENNNTGLARSLNKGKKFFKMVQTGNVFDEYGKIFYYNIPIMGR